MNFKIFLVLGIICFTVVLEHANGAKSSDTGFIEIIKVKQFQLEVSVKKHLHFLIYRNENQKNQDVFSSRKMLIEKKTKLRILANKKTTNKMIMKMKILAMMKIQMKMKIKIRVRTPRRTRMKNRQMLMAKYSSRQATQM